MSAEDRFAYHYENEAEQYSFYRIPKALFDYEIFKDLSTDAKLLYGMMLDRLGLSVKNNWFDDNGHAYIYFTLASIMECFQCGSDKATKLLNELDTKRGIGLIHRVRQGLGKPDIIFVKRFTPKAGFQTPEKSDSGFRNKRTLVSEKSGANNTDTNKTDISDTEKDKYTRHRYGQYQNVLLNEEELLKLKTEFPSDYLERIEAVSAYVASTGKHYKNFLATIRNWAKRDGKKSVGKKAPNYDVNEGDCV